MVTVWLALVPVTRFPKATDAGLTLSVPCCGGGVVPVPLRGIQIVPLVALLLIWRLPLTLPAASGANLTDTAADCPAAIVNGSVAPL